MDMKTVRQGFSLKYDAKRADNNMPGISARAEM